MPAVRAVGRPPVWAVASAAVALIALLAGMAAAQAVPPPGYDPVRMTISALARHGAHHRSIMTLALYLIGFGHLATAAGLRGAQWSARALLALGGVAGVGLATYAQPAHGSSTTHLGFAILGVAALAVFPVVAFRPDASAFPLRPRDALLGGVLSLVLLVWVVQAIPGTTLGLAERAITIQQTLWPLLVVLALRRELRGTAHPAGRRPAGTISV